MKEVLGGYGNSAKEVHYRDDHYDMLTSYIHRRRWPWSGKIECYETGEQIPMLHKYWEAQATYEPWVRYRFSEHGRTLFALKQ